jgi:drug/metabolite transporter (DMT)-like permease
MPDEMPRRLSGRIDDCMKDGPGVHLKTYLSLFVIVVFAPLGSVLLGKGMKGVGSAANWRLQDFWPVVSRVLWSGYIWLGIASLLTFFVAYMLILSWADYSYVQPSTSLSYATVALLSHFVLGELISPLRWLGVFVICTGVFIVGRTNPRAHGTH